MSEPAPAVGRVCHYVARGSADGVFLPVCRAATITQAGAWVDIRVSEYGPDDGAATRQRVIEQRWVDDAAHLHVMNPTGTFTYGPMVHDPGQMHAQGDITPLCTGLVHEPGSWHWPARV